MTAAGNEMNGPEAVRIRPAKAAEIHKAARFLGLGEKPPLMFIAGLPEERVLAGAAAMWPPKGKVIHPGLRFALKIRPGFRRRGIGTLLLEALLAEARRVGARGLFSNAPLGRGPAAAFLQGFGFEPVRQKLFFSCTVRSFYERVAPIARRIEIRPGKLRGVRALPLHAADEQEVIRLYTLCLGDFTVPTEVLFSGEGQRAFHPNSPVMVREGRAVGAVLFRGLGGTAEIDAYVVHPDFRKTRLAPLLIARFADAARDLELNRLAFNCYEEVTDTVNLARRMDARTEKVLSHYLLRLDSSP